MSEKAIAIGFYAVSSGIFVVLGDALPIVGGPAVAQYLTEGMEKDFGARFAFEKDPIAGARLMIERIDGKRAALKLSPMMYDPRPADAVGSSWEPRAR